MSSVLMICRTGCVQCVDDMQDWLCPVCDDMQDWLCPVC